jgi:amidase
MELWRLDAIATRTLVANGEVTAREVVEAHLDRISSVNGQLNAIVRDLSDEALASADRVDSGVVTGSLAGVVATSKINTDHAGHPTDNGVVAFANVMPPGTNPTVQGLIDAGCSMVGRTNSPAVAMRFDTDNQLHGSTRNPFHPDVTPGGSSGGAGVAVATGMCAIAQGNDIGGSVRWPAFCNGVVGHRPTIGRMSTFSTTTTNPRLAAGQLMATNGPLARTVADAHAGYVAMSAPNWADPLWSPVPPDARLVGDARTTRRVALVVDDGLPMHPGTREAVVTAGLHLVDAGYDVEEVNPPSLDRLFSLWGRIGATEVRSALVPMLSTIGDPGLDTFVTDWMSILPEPSLDDYLAALVERDVIHREWNTFFDEHSLIVMPTYTQPSMGAGADLVGPDGLAALLEAARYLLGLPPLGVPALAVPVGEIGGLRQGVQLVARRWRDDLCFAAGVEIEQREGVREVVDPAW